MYSDSNSSGSQFNKTMNDEQFNQIVDAILSGKYSWACLLILRFSGYNPLHYIPYRTYNRLMKSNREQARQQPQADIRLGGSQSNQGKSKFAHKLKDLHYLESIEPQSAQVKGGKRVFALNLLSRLLTS